MSTTMWSQIQEFAIERRHAGPKNNVMFHVYTQQIRALEVEHQSIDGKIFFVVPLLSRDLQLLHTYWKSSSTLNSYKTKDVSEQCRTCYFSLYTSHSQFCLLIQH